MSKINVGGQAVIEGVMMRGSEYIATAVRKPSGEIVYKREKISQMKNMFLKIPFIRGGVLIFEALIVGIKELTFSANESEDDIEKHEEITEKGAVITAIISLMLGVLLFMVLPSILSTFILKENRVGSNILEAAFRIVFFVVYIKLISLSKDVKRVFQYHGAEHKAIYTYEDSKELSVENAKDYTTLHPRCGTSFLLIVMLTSIITFTAVDFFFPMELTFMEKLLYRIGSRIILMPIIAGISYELQRYSSRHLNNPVVKLLASPGLALQKITTIEPDDTQLEVALVALRLSLGEEVPEIREIKKVKNT